MSLIHIVVSETYGTYNYHTQETPTSVYNRTFKCDRHKNVHYTFVDPSILLTKTQFYKQHLLLIESSNGMVILFDSSS